VKTQNHNQKNADKNNTTTYNQNH